MPDVASTALIRAMISRNDRILDGRLPPPRRTSLFKVHLENLRLRKILAWREADIAAAAIAKRQRLPYPSDLRERSSTTTD